MFGEFPENVRLLEERSRNYFKEIIFLVFFVPRDATSLEVKATEEPAIWSFWSRGKLATLRKLGTDFGIGNAYERRRVLIQGDLELAFGQLAKVDGVVFLDDGKGVEELVGLWVKGLCNIVHIPEMSSFWRHSVRDERKGYVGGLVTCRAVGRTQFLKSSSRARCDGGNQLVERTPHEQIQMRREVSPPSVN